MINFIWFFIIIYLFSKTKIHNQSIEDISSTFNFELIKNQKD